MVVTKIDNPKIRRTSRQPDSPNARNIEHPHGVRSIRPRMKGGAMPAGQDHGPTAFGRYLEQAIADANLTQTELADKAGIAQATISRWINQPISPDPKKLALVAPLLKKPLKEMLARAGHPAIGEAVEIRDDREWPDPVLEIREMLASTSPLTPAERAEMTVFLDLVVERFRKSMKRRRRAS